MDNILEKHINTVQKNLKKYNNLILKSKYDKIISDELIQTYIDARYYNYDVNPKIRVFYRRIYDSLAKKAKILIEKEPRKTELINNTLSLFQYYFYFDHVRSNVSVNEIIGSITEKRIFKFNLKSALKDNFKQDFSRQVLKDEIKFENSLTKYDSNDFKLELKRITPKDNIYRVKLKYNFNFPEIFSIEAIEHVFNTDIIAEDKLFVEYPLITVRTLKDILEGNFNKEYICDFSTDLFSKKKKLDQILQVMNNPAAQDKILFEVTYDQFLNNKQNVFNLIKKGFRFALKSDEDMKKLSEDELKILEVFSIIITNKKDINRKKYKHTKIIEI